MGILIPDGVNLPCLPRSFHAADVPDNAILDAYGLSTGITPKLPGAGQIALIVLMYLGRTGPHTLGLALALRERQRRIRFAEGRPIIG